MGTKRKKEVFGKESWRDLSITKKCATCGKKYHPRRNSYQFISQYCSRECSQIGRRKAAGFKRRVPEEAVITSDSIARTVDDILNDNY